MQLILYTINKRTNSTKQPQAGMPYNIVLKQPCSIENPIFILSANLAVIAQYNYAEFMDKYYYIDDIISLTNTQCEIRCSVDALATYRADILKSTQYVEYATSGSTAIIDPRMLISSVTERNIESQDVTFFDYDGAYILTVIGQGSPATGFADAFAFNKNQIVYFAQQISDEGLLEMIKKYVYNPYDTIISCMWVPFSLGNIGGTVNTVRLATYDTGVAAPRVDNPKLRGEIQLDIPGRTGTFLDMAPFTTIRLFLPFYGVAEIDPSLLFNCDKINVMIRADSCTGDLCYYVETPSGYRIASYAANCGCQIPVATTQQYNPIGLLTNVVGGAVTAWTGTGSIQSISGNIAGTFASLQAQHNTGGTLGSRAAAEELTARLIVERRTPAESVTGKRNVIGLPFGKTVLLLGMVGQFIQTRQASVNTEGTKEETETVNTMLDRGVYLE